MAKRVGNLPLAVHLLAQQSLHSKISITQASNLLNQEDSILHELYYKDKHLYSTIAASYKKLPDSEKSVLVSASIFKGKDFSANLMIQPVIKNDTNKTHGVLFDIDIFQNGEFESKNISKILKEFRQYLADENGFLSVVNSTFE